MNFFPSNTIGEFKEYFATFGKVVEQEIMIDYATGKSRGFGFITFDDEDIVEEILSLGIMHEINDKKVSLFLHPLVFSYPSPRIYFILI